MDSDSFGNDPESREFEVNRILTEYLKSTESYRALEAKSLRDFNGNTVGSVEIWR